LNKSIQYRVKGEFRPTQEFGIFVSELKPN